MCKKRHTQLFSESASSLVAAPCLQLCSSSTYVLWNNICMHGDSETFGPFSGDNLTIQSILLNQGINMLHFLEFDEVEDTCKL